MFGMFGGAIEEGESTEVALLREIREELNYRPTNVRFFERYQCDHCELNVFLSEVGEHFEAEITVLEGEYGRFFNEAELQGINVSEIDRTVLKDVFGWLNTRE
jgi:8-oxo-dGTP pyrophosphatase MutT (NUDIX family)